MLMFQPALLFLLVTYYGPTDPDLHKYFESLRTPAGGFCCAEADGIKLDDPDWGKDDQGFYVILDGRKVRAPPGTIVTQRHPRVQYPVVWTRLVDGKREVRCFLPGPTT